VGKLVIALATLFVGAAVPWAATAQVGHEGHHGTGGVPREILERPVALRAGIGTLHQKVATTSQEAQAFYDQGLAYVHSYVWIEAVRSFHQALRLDPSLAIAYLGLTDAYIGMHDPATARAAFQRAQELAPKLNKSEQMWVAIRGYELDYLESEGTRTNMSPTENPSATH